MRRSFALLLLFATACGTGLDQFSAGGPETPMFGEDVVQGPVIAANQRDEFLMTWTARDPNDQERDLLFKSEYRAGSWLDPASPADAVASVPRNYPWQIGLSNNGDAVIVWSDDTGLYARSSSGGVWSPAELIGPAWSYAKVGIDDAGDVLAAWRFFEDCGSQICTGIARIERRQGAWDPAPHKTVLAGSERPDNVSRGGDGFDLSVAGNGDALIAWAQYIPTQASEGEARIFVSERRNDQWMDPVSADDRISPPGGQATQPSVALADTGDAVVIWAQIEVGETISYLKSERRGGSWVHPSDATDVWANAWVQQAAGVQMAPNGDTIAWWAEPSNGLLYQYQNGAWSSQMLEGQEISVGIDPAGDATAVWLQSVAQITRVYRGDRQGGVWSLPTDAMDFLSPLETNCSSPTVALGSKGLIAWREGEYLPTENIYDTKKLRRLWF